MSTPALEFHDVSVVYDRKPALYGIDCAIPSGARVGIIGPNGAGKSTLLKAALGLLPVSAGWVKFFGEPCKKVAQRIGYVPQRESVDWDFPVSAFDVALMGRYGKLGVFRRPKTRDREAAMQCLKQVHMEEFADRQISQLSGGQQQRVFLARALAQESDIYLMDEPFAGVDAATEKSIVEILQGMKAQGRTVIAVHHDLTTAPNYFDHLLLLNMRLIAFGRTEDVFTPENLNQTYAGRMTMLSEMALTSAHVPPH